MASFIGGWPVAVGPEDGARTPGAVVTEIVTELLCAAIWDALVGRRISRRDLFERARSVLMSAGRPMWT